MPSVNYSSQSKDMEMWVEVLDQISDWENFKYLKYKDGSCKNNNNKILLSHCFVLFCFFSLTLFKEQFSMKQIMKQFKLCYCYDNENECMIRVFYFCWVCGKKKYILWQIHSTHGPLEIVWRNLQVFLENTIHLVWRFLLRALPSLEILALLWL